MLVSRHRDIIALAVPSVFICWLSNLPLANCKLIASHFPFKLIMLPFLEKALFRQRLVGELRSSHFFFCMICDFIFHDFLGYFSFGSAVAILHFGEVGLIIFVFPLFLANFGAGSIEFLLVKSEWIHAVVIVIFLSAFVVSFPFPRLDVS